ncbi:acyltransferase [Porphyromonas sp. COT-290 OH3588]|uniref:acyltransferase family protein n=1 Tax=Porphyromonas sp. COT-290 OH3588 TaxID=1515617 RepID=UPI00052C35DF|nr:acyltransferase [Porphyromonas sp. COT-290 OH3588]KGO01405.1 hypothetical protein HQ48_04955 [Porphyromonas sp. COT-290 OH3588]
MSFTPKKHYPHLDILKGFAIICVIMGHVILRDIYDGLGLDYHENHTLRLISSFHMPLFVLVSGFLSQRLSFSSWDDVLKYLQTKASQLLLPLLCLPVLYAIIFSVNPWTMLFGLYHGGFWFTWSLFLLFVLFSLGIYIDSLVTPQKHQWQKVLWILAPFILLKALNMPLRNFSGELYSAIGWELLTWLYPYLVTGYLLGHYNLLTKKYIPRPTTAVLFCAIFYIFYMFSDLIPMAHRYNMDAYSLLTYYPAVMSILCALWYGAIKLNDIAPKIGSWLAELGKISLPVYFLHYFFLTNHYLTIPDWVRDYRLPSEIYSLIAIPITAVVLGISLLVIRLIKRFPIAYKLCFGRLPASKNK